MTQAICFACVNLIINSLKPIIMYYFFVVCMFIAAYTHNALALCVTAIPVIVHVTKMLYRISKKTD